MVVVKEKHVTGGTRKDASQEENEKPESVKRKKPGANAKQNAEEQEKRFADFVNKLNNKNKRFKKY